MKKKFPIKTQALFRIQLLPHAHRLEVETLATTITGGVEDYRYQNIIASRPKRDMVITYTSSIMIFSASDPNCNHDRLMLGCQFMGGCIFCANNFAF